MLRIFDGEASYPYDTGAEGVCKKELFEHTKLENRI